MNLQCVEKNSTGFSVFRGIFQYRLGRISTSKSRIPEHILFPMPSSSLFLVKVYTFTEQIRKRNLRLFAV